ncbi:hypothetical protein b3_0245 [Synechococcus phage B3]|nr:hypothetical protein b3_0245 [Synechococcus phage B3]QGT54853.1 hypothetical protein b23_0239 [Synechococcus phage B23]
MLTPIQFKQNFYQMMKEIEDKTLDVLYEYAEELASEIYLRAHTQITQFQWNNLVKTCSVIAANTDRFYMNSYHDAYRSECGTTHCLAGWSISLLLKDTNYEDSQVGKLLMVLENYTADMERFFCEYSGPNNSQIGAFLLSEYVKPFFYITNRTMWKDNQLVLNNTAEELVTKYLINPVLEEAKRESHELTTEVQQFIERAGNKIECGIK